MSWHANAVVTGYGQLALASANDTSLMCEIQLYCNHIICNIPPYGTEHLYARVLSRSAYFTAVQQACVFHLDSELRQALSVPQCMIDSYPEVFGSLVNKPYVLRKCLAQIKVILDQKQSP